MKFPYLPIAPAFFIVFAACAPLRRANETPGTAVNNNTNSTNNNTNTDPSRGVADASAQDRGDAADASKQNGPNNNNIGGISPSRRPADGLGEESIPAILARTRNELKSEQERARKAEEAYKIGQKQIEDMQRSLRAATNELEAAKLDRDRAISKIRDLQERLVTAALRIVESERETLQSKIQVEKIIKNAAVHGFVVDTNENQEGAASRPAGAASRPVVASADTTKDLAKNTNHEAAAPAPAPTPAASAEESPASKPASKDH